MAQEQEGCHQLSKVQGEVASHREDKAHQGQCDHRDLAKDLTEFPRHLYYPQHKGQTRDPGEHHHKVSNHHKDLDSDKEEEPQVGHNQRADHSLHSQGPDPRA